MKIKYILFTVILITIIFCFVGPIGAQTANNQESVVQLKTRIASLLGQGAALNNAQGLSENVPSLTSSQLNDLVQLYSKKIKKIKQKIPATQETADLDIVLKKYGIPDSVQKKLDDINAKSSTWTANYNNIFVKPDTEKKKMLGLIIDKKPAARLKSSATLVPKINYGSGGAVDNFGDTALPPSFDWRNVGGKNYITSVKDQGSCGSCWAFGAVATLEGAINTYYNNPTINQNVSEQDLVSCAVPYGSTESDGTVDGGCSGATDAQISQIYSNYLGTTGVTQETCFPYSATDSACSSKCTTWQSQVWKTNSSFQSITPTIDNIKSALVNYGPVNVGMDVYSDFSGYTSGIYQPVNNVIFGQHSVTIVGYGNENNLPYWIVKNSWGSNWGEGGYFRIAMGVANIDSWFAYAPGIPYYNNPYARVCTDSDNDGYCYWGTGPKPTSGCPTSCATTTTEDCDDSVVSVHASCAGRASTLTVNILNISSGGGAWISVNGGTSTLYTTPITLGTGNTFTVIAKPIANYGIATSGICDLSNPGVTAGETYVCNIIYQPTTLTVKINIANPGIKVSVNGAIATLYTAPITLSTNNTFTVITPSVSGSRINTTGTCNLASPGAVAGTSYVCNVDYLATGLTWIETQPVGNVDKYWSAVASSSDGVHLIAGVQGRLYISSNSGAIWTETQPAGNVDEYWSSLASSSDGSRLFAGVNGGRLYVSSNYGATWIETQPAGNVDENWVSVASSADGSHLIAANQLNPGGLYTSSNYGATWIET